MNTISIRKWLGLLTVSALLSACAEYDVKQNNDAPESAKTKSVEVPKTAQKYSKEEASTAIAQAISVKSRAQDLGGVWRDTGKMIKTAQASLDKNNNDKAYKFAMLAREQSELAINQSYLEMANHKIGQAKEAMDKNDAAMLARINEAESAYLNDEGEKAHTMAVAMLEDLNAKTMASKEMPKAQPMQAEAKEAPAEPMAQAETMTTPSSVTIGESRSEEMQLLDQYKVVSGDSLWGISKKPEIYNNPYQWPLIYKTNRDQIKDPDLIMPGMLLAIDRAISEAEINAAIMHAKQRGSWALGEVEANDQAYLNGESVASAPQ